ncbi:hypothetical protein [Sphingomonas sp. BK235]|uniref:hypothetical protein n=1 Tax=Sphingomonas sp. BK235 TaxID=2512131 RepID=UPI001046B13D|nr:hypothetical protein [Sphingomonas sp. BK235]TCP31822.1 hypothetical protein EV292_1091 [Sphingomonas sp. BK235]
MTDTPPHRPGDDVADDLAAIFGPGRREAPPASGRAAAPPRRRGVALAALGTLGVAGAVVAGVLAGTQAIDPAAVPAPRARVAAARPAAVAPARVVVPPALAPAPQLAAATPPAEADPAAPRKQEPSAPPSATRVAALAPPRAGSGAPLRVETSARPRAVRAALPRRVRCGDDAACLGERLYAADGAVAGAYAEASDAGVRARLLRAYRGEWLRARDIAADEPREALRVYAMIAADLRMLAEESDARAPEQWQ